MKELSEYMKSFSNSDTLKIILELDSGPKRPRELKKRLNFSYPKVSYHLSKLKKYKIIKAEKYGFFSKYSLRETPIDDLIKMIKENN